VSAFLALDEEAKPIIHTHIYHTADGPKRTNELNRNDNDNKPRIHVLSSEKPFLEPHTIYEVSKAGSRT
ncbi:MAG: hypothetical protein OK454_10380, partial [Thaumarchaeota archaeon]|nr:hypothetical protein [Nitrososphaerota archaeon]